ncbi:MAG: hypothetical protein WBF53_04280 [Litorimonas sp.]
MEQDRRRLEAKAKFKRYALWYILISAPICLTLMFWPMAENVTIHGKLAHYVAIPLAFLSGLFFMGVIFFSSHSGGDEQPNYVEMMARKRSPQADIRESENSGAARARANGSARSGE